MLWNARNGLLLVAWMACGQGVWADPRLLVDVTSQAQRVDVRLTHSAPLEGVSQRWMENPRRLEITIPKAEWSGKGTVPVDRGVIQKVQVQQVPGAVKVQVLTLGSPKMSWAGSADRKVWTLRISPTDMVSAGQLPGLPAENSAQSAKTSVARPVAAPSGKPPAGPSQVATKAPESVKPPEAVKPPESVKPPEAAKPPVARPEQKLISVKFQEQDLASALKSMAQAAGMQVEIGPGVEGKVTMAFTDTPLSKVLTSVLGRQENLYEYRIEGNRIRVFGDGGQAGSTLVVPVSPERGAYVSDYLSLQADKPVREVLDAVRKIAGGVELIPDERLNVLFVRGEEADLEKVRNLLRGVLVK